MPSVPRSGLRPTAFLDRDGVLNVDREYVHRADQVIWIDGAADAIRFLNELGYLVFVVTNQSGVARGLYDEAAVVELHQHMRDHLLAKGARIDAFYYCPHHPEGVSRYALRCACRKPAAGMLEQAAREWPVDRAHSFLIGDKDSDIAAATAFGIRSARFDATRDRLPDLVRQMAMSS